MSTTTSLARAVRDRRSIELEPFASIALPLLTALARMGSANTVLCSIPGNAVLGHKLLKPITVQPTTEKGLQESTARAIRGVQLRGEAGSSPGPLRRALTTQNL